MKFNGNKSTVFSCDELPMPVIVYRQDTGQILQYNKAAKRALGSPVENIAALRPEKLRKNTKATINFGPVIHYTAKGREVLLTVLRKPVTLQKIKCYVDFLETADETVLVKNEIMKNSLDGFISVNEDQQILDWNTAAEHIFGWKRSQVVGQRLSDIIIPKHLRDRHLSAFKHYQQSGKKTILNKLIETSGLHKNGHEFPIELTVKVVSHRGRKLFYSFVRDISNRKKAEQALQASEHKLKKAQSLAAIGSWEMYGNFNEVYWSDEFYSIHGLEPNSVKPSTRLRLSMVHPKDRTKLQQAIDEAARLGKPFAVEKRIVLPTGDIRWVLSQGESTKDEVSGKRKVFGTLLDITAQKVYEALITKTNASLSETLVFGKMGSAELDLQTLDVTVSKELFLLLDVEASEPQTMPVELFLKTYVQPDFLELVQQKIQEGMSNKPNEKTVVKAEFKMVTAKGRHIWIEAMGIFKDTTALGILHEITERKKAQEDLVESNELFSRLADNVPGMIYKFKRVNGVTGSGKFIFASNGCESLFGVSTEQIKSEGFTSMIHPDDLPDIQQKIEEKYRDRLPWSSEFRIVMPDGTVKWIAGASNPYKGKDGEYVWYGFMYDVTIRKLAELKISESELTKRLIIENSGEGILFTDTIGNIFSANPEACRIFGMTEEEICKGGRNALFDFSDPQLLLIMEERNERGFLHGELKLKRKDGTTFMGEITSKIFSNLKGELNTTLIVRDITVRRRAQDALIENEQRLKLILNGLPVAVYLTDQHGYITDFNKAAEKLWGRSVERGKEQWCGSYQLFNEEGVPIAHSECPMALAIRDQVEIAGQEAMLARPDGRKVSFMAYATPFRKDNNGLNGAMNVMVDISERKEIEKIIQESFAALGSEMDKFQSLVSTIDGIVWEADVETFEFKFVSQQAETILGYPVAEWLHNPSFWASKIHDDDRDAAVDFCVRATKELRNHDFEYRMIAKNGGEVWIQDNVTVIHTDGKPLQLRGILIDITKRKVDQQRIAEKEQHLRAMLNASKDVTFFLDLEANIRVANTQAHQYAKRLFQKDFEIGDSFIDIIPEVTHENFKTNFEKALLGELVNLEIVLQASEGSTWLSLTYLPVRNEENEIIGASVNATDITKRKYAELALKRNEERFKLLYNHTPVMMHSIEVDGRLSRVSDYWLQKMEYAREEVVGKRSIDFMTAESKEKAITHYLPEFFKTGTAHNFEYDFVTKSGKILNTLLSSSAEYDDQGKIVRSLAVVTDISETKKLARRLELANKAARLGVWQIDFANNTWECDEKLREIFGIEEKTITREKYWRIIHPDEIEAKIVRDRLLLQSLGTHYADEYRIVRPSDQEVRYIKSQGIFFRDENGNPLSGVSVVYDQTQEKLSEKRILQSLKEKETLIKEVHHRIKNNLQLISSIVYLKLSTINHGESDIRDFLEGMRQKIKSIAVLHERLLQTEKLDLVNIDDFLNKVMKDIQVSFYRPGLALETKTEVLPVMLPSDVATYCGLILNELVTNTIKHAFPGESKGKVVVNFWQEEDEKFLLRVSDNGIGLPEGVGPQETGNFGMSLLNIFIKQLGGDCSIHRENGTDFQIRFPLKV